MRKWGLHYLLYLVVVAVVLTGCGASSNNSDSAANSESAFRNEAGSDGSAESAPAAVEAKEDSQANTAMAVNDQAAVKGGGGNSAVPGADAGQGNDASAGFTGTDVVAGLNKADLQGEPQYGGKRLRSGADRSAEYGYSGRGLHY
ncbi:hypothetical protein [Paenibacillus rhizoplanae]|uniref:hypothetical protein n=1 Tax=Paenibacillus rhizoplanae TaxID=1917181 RepID=UPI00360F8CB4